MKAMRLALPIVLGSAASAMAAISGPYSGPPGTAGSTAVPWTTEGGSTNYDPRIIGWASEVVQVVRGPEIISDPAGTKVSWGQPTDALGPADAYGSENFDVISLGDGGSITLKFPEPIGNGPGPDLAVFENAFANDFLELAFVEVSSDGITFHRFPSISLTQTDTQIGGFGLLDTTNLHNLAGKYRSGWGTPFDLADLAGIEGLNISLITHARIVDVVGSIEPEYARYDSLGNIINDPWSTEWESGGFDLDAVAYMNVIPEPSATLIFAAGALLAAAKRRRRM